MPKTTKASMASYLFLRNSQDTIFISEKFTRRHIFFNTNQFEILKMMQK